MSSTYFITGTDTGCGKTTVTAALARHWVGLGLKVACFKPLASGCQRLDGQLVNADALELIAAMNVELRYEQVNPIALEAPVAPHLEAERAGICIDPAAIALEINAISADVKLVEGVGGWQVPIDATRFVPEFPQRLGCAVILVVGMRLGCLNHALLSVRAISADGLRLAGWVANFLDPQFDRPAANLAYLEQAIDAPLLATMSRSAALRLLLDPRPPRAVANRPVRQ
ncbi:MAG: dethiobiotin synthase [Xanthomonadaceae bacterium]|nr:dethiobiotin synthase [Xanthomonadaceae bacterium]